MKRLIVMLGQKARLAGIVVVCCASPVLAQDDRAPEQVPAAEIEQYQDELADVVQRGRLLYVYDLAAAMTSDVLLEQLPEDRFPLGNGWIVLPNEQDPDNLTVIYLGRDDTGLFELASMNFGAEGVSDVEIPEANERVPVPDRALPLIRARDTAMRAASESDYRLCSGPTPNIVILPVGTDGAYSVYILSPQPEQNVVLAGGHYRYDIDPEGQIVAHRRFMNSCLELGRSEDGSVLDNTVGYAMSHSLDPHPTEIHIFLSLISRKLIHIVTMENHLIWAIENGQFVTEPEIDPSENQ